MAADWVPCTPRKNVELRRAIDHLPATLLWSHTYNGKWFHYWSAYGHWITRDFRRWWYKDRSWS